MRYFFWANQCTKIFCFCVHSGAHDLIYPGTSLYEHILWMHLEKNRSYACTFPVQRKEINVVKVRFTMRYSSRKLSNEKVITTACNFWRQIACSFLVKSGNWRFIIMAKNFLKSRHFFKPGQGIWAKKFTHAHYVFPPWRWNVDLQFISSQGPSPLTWPPRDWGQQQTSLSPYPTKTIPQISGCYNPKREHFNLTLEESSWTFTAIGSLRLVSWGRGGRTRTKTFTRPESLCK